MKSRLIGIGLALAGLLLVTLGLHGGRPGNTPDAPSPGLDGLPGLPAWQASGQGAAEPLPDAPSGDGIAAFVAGAGERFRTALPERWRLALARGRLLGPDGALALARHSGYAVTESPRREVMRAVAAAATSAARRNDFPRAEALLSALQADERALAEVGAAVRLLESRQALWERDPERADRIAASVAAAAAGLAAGLAAGDATGLEAALAAARRLAAEDPDHEDGTAVEAEVAARVRAAWGAALDARDWQAIEGWSAWAARNLPAARVEDLAAATRAARERQAAPAPAARR